MGKLAIARIEREAKEREEAEQAKEQAEQQSSGNVHRPETGDLEALSKYEKSWHTKLSLHGAEGLRAQIGKESGVTNGGFSSQPSHPSGHSFNPPARGAGNVADSPVAPSLEERTARERPGVGPMAGASDFRAQRSAFHHDAADNAVETALEGRQWSAIGDDPWIGTGSGRSSTDHLGHFAAPAMGGGRASEAEPEVMPQIWERLAPASRQAELDALDMNLRSAAAPSNT